MKIKIGEVPCYGELEDTSNFEVRFSDEQHDLMWITRDPDVIKTWSQIVKYWERHAEYMTEQTGELVELWEIESDSS